MFKGNTTIDKGAYNVFCCGFISLHIEWYYFPLWIITDARRRLCKSGLVEIRIFSLVRDKTKQREQRTKALFDSREYIWWPNANITDFRKCLILQVSLCSVRFSQHICYFILIHAISTRSGECYGKKLYKHGKCNPSDQDKAERAGLPGTRRRA